MLKKKFRVRVKHYAEQYYQIQYAHYYLIPIYRSFKYWFALSLISDLESWATFLLKYEPAEKFAKGLKSIEDVKNWYKMENTKMNNFYKNKEKYISKNIPYNTRYF